MKQTQTRNFATLSKMREFSGDSGLEVEKEDFVRGQRDQVWQFKSGRKTSVWLELPLLDKGSLCEREGRLYRKQCWNP